MKHSEPLSSLQQCVADALDAGCTFTNAAAQFTVYRFLSARADFLLARRDDLHHLSNRAPFKTAAFILTRPQIPETGWTMPEPSPKPGDNKLTGSATLEQDYDSLPGLYRIEEDPPSEAEIRFESAASNSQPPPASPAPAPPMQPNATGCNMIRPFPALHRSSPNPSRTPAYSPPASSSPARAAPNNLDSCENSKVLEAIARENLKRKPKPASHRMEKNPLISAGPSMW